MRVIFFVRIAIFCLFGIVSTITLSATSDADLTFLNPTQEMRYRALIEEFRCPKCQNANLAGSDAPIAQDLKHKTYLLIQQGQSDDQIRQYMTSRYGDFISYKPPINHATWLLWFAPPVGLIIVLLVWLIRTRSRKNLNVVPLSAEESWQLNRLLGKNNAKDQDIRHDH
ncbi:MAG: cytochrome c-type biogenesis protein CcmH [Gammaproteobacteria bacterium]|nr:cytochrome c-type biogenesis protein CcmH [Gammaproteobacteria bacterium]